MECQFINCSYSPREKVEADLQRLQRQGVIEPIQFSDWAMPIVPGEKGDGSVRIYGDYRITVNRVARQTPTPFLASRIWSRHWQGGTKFRKLDLLHDYLRRGISEVLHYQHPKACFPTTGNSISTLHTPASPHRGFLEFAFI